MTAKEALLERIVALSEEEAAEALDLLGYVDDQDREFPVASPKVMEMFRRAMADSDAGRTLSDEEFGRRHGLDD